MTDRPPTQQPELPPCLQQGHPLRATVSEMGPLLIARLLQGLGSAGPRVVSLALVRDLYKGRDMARVVSFAMMIFTLVPAIAPFIGEGIMWVTGWRGIFLAFLLFSGLSMLWFWLRQPETLTAAQRRPLRVATLRAAFQAAVLTGPIPGAASPYRTTIPSPLQEAPLFARLKSRSLAATMRAC